MHLLAQKSKSERFILPHLQTPHPREGKHEYSMNIKFTCTTEDANEKKRRRALYNNLYVFRNKFLPQLMQLMQDKKKPGRKKNLVISLKRLKVMPTTLVSPVNLREKYESYEEYMKEKLDNYLHDLGSLRTKLENFHARQHNEMSATMTKHRVVSLKPLSKPVELDVQCDNTKEIEAFRTQKASSPANLKTAMAFSPAFSESVKAGQKSREANLRPHFSDNKESSRKERTCDTNAKFLVPDPGKNRSMKKSRLKNAQFYLSQYKNS